MKLFKKYINGYQKQTEINKIKKICKQLGLIRYSINDDLSVDIDGSFGLHHTDFIINENKLPIQFGIVRGDFDCSFCDLETLEGAPREVHGNFNCSNNWLTNFEHIPSLIKGSIDFCSNKIESFEGLPDIGKDIICSDNKIWSFDNIPTFYGKLSLSHYDNSFNIRQKDNKLQIIWSLFEDESKIELFLDYDPIKPAENGGKPILYREYLEQFLYDIDSKIDNIDYVMELIAEHYEVK